MIEKITELAWLLKNDELEVILSRMNAITAKMSEKKKLVNTIFVQISHIREMLPDDRDEFYDWIEGLFTEDHPNKPKKSKWFTWIDEAIQDGKIRGRDLLELFEEGKIDAVDLKSLSEAELKYLGKALTDWTPSM